jgi:hypothetical protein
MTGILAVWNDRADAVAAEYEDWYVSEHIPERLAVGLNTARRYAAVEADRMFFTFYEADEPEVMSTPTYLERLANPTPRTKAIMPHFQRMIRSVFLESQRSGDTDGEFAVVIRYAGGVSVESPAKLPQLAHATGIARMRVWESTSANTPTQTAESRTRSQPDEVASGALVIEMTSLEAAKSLAASLRESATPGSVGVYQLLASFAR